jgi:hypothetical protein
MELVRNGDLKPHRPREDTAAARLNRITLEGEPVLFSGWRTGRGRAQAVRLLLLFKK